MVMSNGSVKSSKAVIFDCDGVLADTERYGHLVAFNKAFEQMDLGFQWSDDEYRDLLSVAGGKERFRHFMTNHPEYPVPGGDLMALSFEFHKLKSEIYVDLVKTGAIPPRPGVRRLILEAMDSGWEVAVASTASPVSVESVLVNAIGQERRDQMSVVLAGDIVPAKKPAPDIYLLALEQLGMDQSQVVVIEDSPPGAQSAAAAGLKHLVTVSTYSKDDVFPDATTVVDSLGDPEEKASLICGVDVLRDGLVTVESLEQILTS